MSNRYSFADRLSIRLAVGIALSLLILSACANSGQPSRGGPGGPMNAGGPNGQRGMPSLNQSKIAQPASLLFVSMDRDHDLLITSDETFDGIESEWLRADTEGNGKISSFEIDAWLTTVLGDPDAAPTRISFDVNLDGSITPNEFKVRLGDEFARLDANHDGILSRSELLATPRPTPRQSMQAASGAPDRGGRGGPPRIG